MEQNQQNMPQNPYAADTYIQKKTVDQKARAAEFAKLFFPTLLYAVVATFCLYDNFSGILVAGFSLATIIYCRILEKNNHIPVKRGTLFYEVMMVLLGISSGLTGNEMIIICNAIGILLLLLVRLLHQYFNDSAWGAGKYFGALGTAVGGAFGAIPDLFSDAGAYVREDAEAATENRGAAEDILRMESDGAAAGVSSENAAKTRLRGGRKTTTGILIGIGIAVPLLIVIVALLYSADIVFATMLKETFHLNLATVFGVVCFFLVMFTGAYCGLRYLRKHEIKEVVTPHKRYPAVIAITVLSLVAVVYLLFSGIQILYLFIGNMTLPADYTYAQYAREGFFQLLTVSILNVLMVLFVLSFVEESRSLKALLTVISGCTYIMIASSALRMLMYIDAYHLTRKRVLVLWTLATIALLLLGIVITVFKKTFPLFRYGIIVFCLCYLLLSYLRMDYLIADYNLTAFAADARRQAGAENAADIDDARGYVDEHHYIEGYGTDYLATLSTDAAPLYAGENGLWLISYMGRIGDDLNDSLRQWNYSHSTAKQVFRDFNAKKQLTEYVTGNEKMLREVADAWLSTDEYMEIEEPGLYVAGVYKNRDGKHIVQFSSSATWMMEDLYDLGFYYSKGDAPAAYMEINAELTPQGKDTWEWETEDFRGVTEKISDGWYYFEVEAK